MNYTYKDIVKKIKKLGFQKVREGKGSHEIRENEKGDSILLAQHGSKTLSKGVINNVIDILGMTNQEFHNL